VNSTGDVVVGFSGSSASTYASTYAVVGASSGGVPGGVLTFGALTQTKAGTDFYPDTRWGDYSAVTPDPADPGIFWAHQEYAANRFTIGGTTYGNWATQASEIIPTKSGERRWSNTAGGSFATAGNYFTGAAPAAGDLVVFSRPSASYTVTFAGANSNDRTSVRQGSVTWDLTASSYSLTNSNVATPSLVVGEFQGTAALTIAGGALNSVNAAIGGVDVGSGAVTVGANATWTSSNSLTVGGSGTGALTTQSQGIVYVGSNLSIGAFGTVNLNGGTIRFDGYSRAAGGTLSFSSGTVQVAGNRTIDTNAAIQDWFGTAPTIGVGKKLVVEGSATLSSVAPLTLAGGTLAANSLTMSSGSHITSSQSSQVMASVAAQTGSQIDVGGGDLTIGDATNANGFYGNGSLHVGSNIAVLADADSAVLDSMAQVTLGAGANPGTLSAASGLTLNSGGTIAGHGTIDTPNNVAKPLTNNGALNGDSMAAPLTLPGFVVGPGSLDNVKVTGTYSPGAGPAIVSLGSVEYDGALQVEIGGTTPGTEFDQLNHVLNSGAVQLGGELDVSLISGFMPNAGDMFQILTATGGISGTFATTNLPTLAGNLIWQVSYGPNSLTLAVAAPVLPGDFNSDGVVDAADYVVWRKGLGSVYTVGDYDIWRANFGQPAGSGTSRAVSQSQITVPEPLSRTVLAVGILAVVPFCRRLRNRPSAAGCNGSIKWRLARGAKCWAADCNSAAVLETLSCRRASNNAAPPALSVASGRVLRVVAE
jgi:hypothetical protein